MTFADHWPWLAAVALGAGLTFAAPAFREAREPAVRATALSNGAFVRLGAPIGGASDAPPTGIAALEASIDHSGPSGADFWSAHGVAAPVEGGEPAAASEGPVALRFADLVLPVAPAQPEAGVARPARDELFPAHLLALDGREVTLEGFVQPLAARGSRITLFSLLPFPPSCLFGGSLRLDQQVEVSAEALGGVQIHPFLPVRVEGRLAVGEEMDTFGFVRSLYRLEAAGVSRLR